MLSADGQVDEKVKTARIERGRVAVNQHQSHGGVQCTARIARVVPCAEQFRAVYTPQVGASPTCWASQRSRSRWSREGSEEGPRCWAMSEFSACFWGWLANLEKCQADKRQHTGRRRRCCLLGPGPQTTTLTTTTNKQMPHQAKSRKTINENKQREMRSEKNKCKYTGKESAIGNCDCVDCDHLLLPVLALLDCGSVVVWLWQCGCEYCHYLFMPQNVSFSFSFGQGSQRCCWLKETWKLGYWRLFRATRSCHAISIFVVVDNECCRIAEEEKPPKKNRNRNQNQLEDRNKPKLNWQLGTRVVCGAG